MLLSAGVGVTPVLAMLHALAAAGSHREIWWLYGARNRSEHLFASETCEAVRSLPHGHVFVRYSRPAPSDRPEEDYDAVGRWTPEAIAALHLPAGADFYSVAPPASSTISALASLALGWGAIGFTEKFSDRVNRSHRESRSRRPSGRTHRSDLLERDRLFRLRAAASPPAGVHPSRASLNSPKRAIFR